jgi:hypothetical protein
VANTQAATQLEAPQLPTVTNLSPDPGAFEPQFSWDPVPRAGKYEVEVNSAEGFPAGSKWCCSDPTIATSLTPIQLLANNRYYWRVRAVDASGNAGAWNQGASFAKTFDSAEPSIANLTVRNADGEGLGGVPSTDTPIVTWDPVPGASRYEAQVAPHTSFGCDWSQVSAHPSMYRADTSTTAWTPLGWAKADHIGPAAWPPAQETIPALPTAAEYCLRVLARSENDAQGSQVVSDWTQINGAGEAAFYYAPPPATGEPESPFEMPLSAYLKPASGTITPRSPWFSWHRVPGALGYYVVIARDAGFTEVADVGFTNVPAYAPRLANEEPLSDEAARYYWAAIPATGSEGSGVYTVPQDNSPQHFNKSSLPPASLEPANSAEVLAQPTFRWSAAEGARNYRLQVSQDPAFGKQLDDVTTDETAYTSSTAYPADAVLYWRVRANNWIGQGQNWSPVQTFTKRQNPTVATNPASSITQSSATLNATVNPDHETVGTCDFEYGPTESYGSSVQCDSIPGSGGSPVAVSASVTSLSPNSTYHFRIVASGPGGTSYGLDQTLTTQAPLSVPSPPPAQPPGYEATPFLGEHNLLSSAMPGTASTSLLGGQTPEALNAELTSAAMMASSSGNVSVEVVCPQGKGMCIGTITLHTPKVVSDAATGSRAHKQVLTLAAGSFRVAGGRVATVKLHLAAWARALLKHSHVLRARASIVSQRLGAVRRTDTMVVIYAAKPTHRRRT